MSRSIPPGPRRQTRSRLLRRRSRPRSRRSSLSRCCGISAPTRSAGQIELAEQNRDDCGSAAAGPIALHVRGRRDRILEPRLCACVGRRAAALARPCAGARANQPRPSRRRPVAAAGSRGGAGGGRSAAREPHRRAHGCTPGGGHPADDCVRSEPRRFLDRTAGTGRRRPAAGTPPDLDAAVRRALAERPDIVEARTQIADRRDEHQAVEKRHAAGRAGAGNVPHQRRSADRGSFAPAGFPGTIIGTEDTSLARCSARCFTADFPTWTLGVTMTYPLGKSAEEANLARARIERDQAQPACAMLSSSRSARCAMRRCGSSRTASASRPRNSAASSPNSVSTPNRSASKSACRRASS